MKYAHDIIRRPIISERSMEVVFDREGNEIKKYTFEVPVSANKIEIKKASPAKNLTAAKAIPHVKKF